MVYFCRILQGLFDTLNSIGKSYVFEFCDVDYLELSFTTKGFVAIVMGNVFPIIGNHVYDYFDKDYKSACYFWFIFNLIMGGLFYLFFFILPVSDNT